MKRTRKNWLEWAVLGISFPLVVLTLGYLTYEAITRQDAPPRIEVQLGAPAAQGQKFIVPVTATNEGDLTAKNVRIEVISEKGGAVQERDEFEFDFLPRRATRQAWVSFQTDPRQAERLSARVLSYQRP